MTVTMENPPPPTRPNGNRQTETIRGQPHRFMLIPPMEHYCTWFEAGPIAIAVETRALGNAQFIVRGPSIHVFNADRSEEYLRFDVFGAVLHYHYILNDEYKNVLWGYDPDTNGPMIPWTITALRERLPTLLRRAKADQLAKEVEEQGWDTSVLPAVAAAASAALAPHPDDLKRAEEGSAWMAQWQRVHPQFNTVGEGEI